MFDFNGLKRSIEALNQRLVAIQDELNVLQVERNGVLNAPAAKADVKAMLAQWVDSVSRNFNAGVQSCVDEFVRNPQSMRNAQRVGQVMSLALPSAATASPAGSDALDAALCALFGQPVKDALYRAVDEMEWANEGLPLAQRKSAVDKIDERIEELMSEQSQLTAQAAEARIIL